jgi:integrase
MVSRPGGDGDEKMYYVTFKRGDKKIEEKVGGQYRDAMTPAKASRIRADLIEGRRLTRAEERQKKEEQKKADAGRPTLKRLWDLFYTAKSTNKSIRDDRYRWEKHLEPDFSEKTPAELVTLDIDRLRKKLSKKGLAPATVKQVIVLLKRIINFSVQRGHCPVVDPGRLHFEMPKVDNEKTEDLTQSQLNRLLTAIDKSKSWKAAGFLKLALYTGMRRGELLKLRWRDVDLKKGFLKITADSKSGRSSTIPLNKTAIEVFESLPRGSNEYVFPGKKGGRAYDLKRPIADIKEAAGLPVDFRPCHGLRHVFASTLASSGQVDLYTLQKLLTHKSTKMTQRYAHLRDDAMKSAAEVMDQVKKEKADEEKTA